MSEEFIDETKLANLIGKANGYCNCLNIYKYTIAVTAKLYYDNVKNISTELGLSKPIVFNESRHDVNKFKELFNYFRKINLWLLKNKYSNVLVCIESINNISFNMVIDASTNGFDSLIYIKEDSWNIGSINTLIIKKVFKGIKTRTYELIVRVINYGLRCARGIKTRTYELIVRVINYGLRCARKSVTIVRIQCQRFFGFAYLHHRKYFNVNIKVNYNNALWRTVFSINDPLLPIEQFNKQKVILVNSSLAWGGAERQIVNTLIGLKEHGINNVSLICERLHDFTDSDFYLNKLEHNEIQVKKLKNYLPVSTLEIIQLKSYQQLLNAFPNHIKQSIINYIHEFYYSKPEVVHLWQDSTNIIAGIAACIVGVPRIILSTRNMAPFRFAYYQDYMQPGYVALSHHSSVKILNNSNAGKNDYLKWLNLPADKISVILNGIRKSDIPIVSINEQNEFKKLIGIPNDAIVIGSIFRFYQEKDPLLWVKVAVDIAKRSTGNNIVFLLVGTGPMLQSILDSALKYGLTNKIFLPGVIKNFAIPLSIMDIFLLTSINEGTPNVLIEAQLLGIPVVSTDAGGTRDTVNNGITGVIVESRKPIDLAKKVLELLEDKQWLANAHDKAKTFAEEHFSNKKMITETLQVYGYGN